MRQARPTVAIVSPLAGRALLLVGELRRALGHQGVALADELGALLAHRHDDLAALAERVGHRADVAHRHRAGPVAAAHAERLAARDVAPRPGRDLAGQLV